MVPVSFEYKLQCWCQLSWHSLCKSYTSKDEKRFSTVCNVLYSISEKRSLKSVLSTCKRSPSSHRLLYPRVTYHGPSKYLALSLRCVCTVPPYDTALYHFYNNYNTSTHTCRTFNINTKLMSSQKRSDLY